MSTSPPTRGASLSNAPTQLRGQRLTTTAFTASCSTCCRSSSTPALSTVSSRAVQPSAGAKKSPSRGVSIALLGESAACSWHCMAASSKNLRCKRLSQALHFSWYLSQQNRASWYRFSAEPGVEDCSGIWDHLSKAFQLSGHIFLQKPFGGCWVLPW